MPTAWRTGWWCYCCCSPPTTVACLNKLINTYLNHRPLISTCQYCIAWHTVDRFEILYMCERTRTHTPHTYKYERLKEQFGFDVIFWFCVAYYVLSTHHRFCRNSSLAMTQTHTHTNAHIYEFIIISICRFLSIFHQFWIERCVIKIRCFHYLQIYDVRMQL